jgi:hypothetical protein
MALLAAFCMILASSLLYSAGLRHYCGLSLLLRRSTTPNEAFLLMQDGGYVSFDGVALLFGFLC